MPPLLHLSPSLPTFIHSMLSPTCIPLPALHSSFTPCSPYICLPSFISPLPCLPFLHPALPHVVLSPTCLSRPLLPFHPSLSCRYLPIPQSHPPTLSPSLTPCSPPLRTRPYLPPSLLPSFPSLLLAPIPSSTLRFTSMIRKYWTSLLEQFIIMNTWYYVTEMMPSWNKRLMCTTAYTL